MHQLSSVIKRMWESWKRVMLIIGDFQATVLFSILYFLLITPVGIFTSLFKDFFKIRNFPRWQKYDIKLEGIKDLKKQS